MSDLKMGTKHTIFQRLKRYDMWPHKSVAHSNQNAHAHVDVTTPPAVTDFSINRILGENKLNVTRPQSARKSDHPPACPVKPTTDILDLSKSSTTVPPTPFLPSRSSHTYPDLHAQQDFQAKLYSHLFPHLLSPYAMPVFQVAVANAAAAGALPATAYQQQAKRYFTPYIVNSESSTIASDLSPARCPPAGPALRPTAPAPVPLDMLRCENYYRRLNYSNDNFDYYRADAFKRGSLSSPSSTSSTSTLSALSRSEYLRNSSPPNLFLGSPSVCMAAVTNLNLTPAKSSKSQTTAKSATTTTTTVSVNSEEISYKCRICDKVFGCSQTLQAHEKTHKSPRYECTDCGKGFSQLRNYKYHLSVHRGTKEFAAECPECGKTFNDKGYLSSHMKIHRNKKEYECPYCPKSFNQRVAFNMHVRIHTGVKPHKCAECGKRFSRKMLLKQHMRTHSGEKPYQCSVCGKSFADRSNMTLHHRLHSGIKPFNCPICPKAFTKKHHLKTHLNYHTGCKPYVCPHPNCNQAFTQSSNMRTHAKKCQYRPLQLPFPAGMVTTATSTSTTAAAVGIATAQTTPGGISNALMMNSTTQSIPSRMPLPAGIRMLTAATTSATTIVATATQHQQQQQQQHALTAVVAASAGAFPPAQQPLLSTLRPF